VPPLPVLSFSSAPANAHVLDEGTYGTGASAIDVPNHAGPLYVIYACVGTGTIDFAAFNGSEQIHTRGGCADGEVGTALLSVQSLKGPVSVTITAAPKTLWQIVLYELPPAKS
jgi:hypothetical protein